MIPRFANPHFLPDRTTTVSRSALRDSDDESEHEEDAEHAARVARLEQLIKRSIEHVDVVPVSNGIDAHDDAVKDAYRRKKRKLRHPGDAEDEPVAVPFRLLSSALPPAPIVLAHKPPPAIIVRERQYEDTEQELERRRARAREVAVDTAWLAKESALPTYRSSGKLLRVSAELADPAPALLALERAMPVRKPPRVAEFAAATAVANSPHLDDIVCCPVVRLDSGSDSVSEAKRRRRRGKRDRVVVQPTFWRPTLGLGGKSAGYAWGYEGSEPLAEGALRTYQRDNMRKATLEV